MNDIAVIFLLLVLGGGNSYAVAAVLPYPITAEELRRLPSYCAVRMTSDMRSPEYRAWRERIGKNFDDLHHYCSGLKFINRYWGSNNANERSFYLQSAKAEFDYVTKDIKTDFTMGAELFSSRAEVFKLMGKMGEAIRDYNKSLSINPEFVKSYLQLADLYVTGNAPGRALETITEGLRHLPDSKALQRRYLELGGKKPFPEAIAAKKTEIVSPRPVDATPTPETAKESTPASAVSAGSEPPTAKTESPLPIGTPKNPYCRFCPPE